MQKPRQWLLDQILTIGSSAAGVVAGQSPYQSPAELYDAMVQARTGVVEEKFLTDDMRRGLYTEPLHRDILTDELKEKVHDHDQNDFRYNPTYPWAHALPDGWLLANTEYIPVQLKCPRIRAWHEIRLKGLHGHWLLGTQHSLAVLEAPYEIFSVLNVETMRIIHFPVYRDEQLISSLMAIEEKFWTDLNAHVRPSSVMPEIQLPPFTGELIEINTEAAMRAASAYLVAKDYREEAQTLLDAATEKLKELMQGARVADMPGIRAYHIPQPGRKTLNRDLMIKAGIKVEEFETVGKPYDTFRVYPRRP